MKRLRQHSATLSTLWEEVMLADVAWGQYSPAVRSVVSQRMSEIGRVMPYQPLPNARTFQISYKYPYHPVLAE